MRQVFEITLVSGDAEACMLIEAATQDEAQMQAAERVYDGDFCWEGNSDPSSFYIQSVVIHEC